MEFLRITKNDFVSNNALVKLSFSEFPRVYFKSKIGSEIELLISGSSDLVFPIAIKKEAYTFIGWDTKVFGVDSEGLVKMEINLLSYFFNFILSKNKLIVISEVEVHIIDLKKMLICNQDTFGDLIVNYELIDSKLKVLLNDGETYFVSI